MISNGQDYYDIQEEIEDRFGDMPQPVINLLNIALLKAAAHSAGITGITQKGKNIVLVFKPDANVNPVNITETVKESKGRLLFTIAPNPYLTYKMQEDENPQNGLVTSVLRGYIQKFK